MFSHTATFVSVSVLDALGRGYAATDGTSIGGIRTGAVNDTVTRFAPAYEKARYAESLESLGRIREATDVSRRIFGDYFPAYG